MACLHVSLLDITLTSAGAFRMVLQGNRPVNPSLCMNQMWHVRSASAQHCKSSWVTTPLAADCVHLLGVCGTHGQLSWQVPSESQVRCIRRARSQQRVKVWDTTLIASRCTCFSPALVCSVHCICA